MPRLLLPLGIAALIALAAFLLLGGDGDGTAPDGTREDAWRDAADDDGATTLPEGDAPILRTTAAEEAKARREAEEEAQRKAKGPTGPFRFVVTDATTQVPIAEVEIVTGPRDLVLGTTDSEGRLTVEDAGAATFLYRARRAGYVTREGYAAVKADVLVEMEPGVPIDGRVVRDADDTPVVGAVITVWDDDYSAAVASLRTEGGGRFRVTVRPNHPIRIFVGAPELNAPYVKRDNVAEAQEDYELRIGAGGTVTGTVRDAKGKPRPKTVVLMIRKADEGPWRKRDDKRRARREEELRRLYRGAAVTDDKGVYRFTGVAPGVTVRPFAIVGPRHFARGKRVTFKEAGEIATRDIDVPRPAAVRIRVEDERGEAIGHAELSLQGSADGHITLFPSDPFRDGARLVETLTPQTFYAQATLPNARPRYSKRVAARPGETVELRIVFPIGRKLFGVVQDKRGQPIWRAKVSWLRQGGNATTLTDNKGRWQLERLTADSGVLLFSARGLGYTTRTYEPKKLENVAPGQGRLEVTLLDGTHVTGRFVDLPKGADVTCELKGADDGPKKLLLTKEQRFKRSGPDPDGSGGLYIFRTRGLPPIVVDERRYPFTSEETRDLGDLRFVASNPMRGRVLTWDKRPVRGAKVTVIELWSNRMLRTDAKGEFVLMHMPDRHLVRLRLDAPGYPPQRSWLERSSAYVTKDLYLRRGSTLTVQAYDRISKRPAAGALVRLRDSWPDYSIETGGQTDGQGRFTTTVVAGYYSVSIFDPRTRRSGYRSVQVEDGKDAKTTVTLAGPR